MADTSAKDWWRLVRSCLHHFAPPWCANHKKWQEHYPAVDARAQSSRDQWNSKNAWDVQLDFGGWNGLDIDFYFFSLVKWSSQYDCNTIRALPWRLEGSGLSAWHVDSTLAQEWKGKWHDDDKEKLGRTWNGYWWWYGARSMQLGFKKLTDSFAFHRFLRMNILLDFIIFHYLSPYFTIFHYISLPSGYD